MNMGKRAGCGEDGCEEKRRLWRREKKIREDGGGRKKGERVE